MWPDSGYAHPVSSYQNPVPPPSTNPEDGPFTTVAFNSAWLPYVVGSLKQLLLQTTWDTTDSSVLALAQERAFNLLNLFTSAAGVLGVRQSPDNPCILQEETSPGVWEDFADLSLCGAAAGYIKNSDGSWSPTPPGATDVRFTNPGPPPWPSGSVPVGQTAQCLAGANNAQAFKTCINNLVTVLNAGADSLGVLASVNGIVGLFMPVDEIIGIILGFVGLVIGIGGSGLSSLFADADYHKYACIINCHCEPDGSVTQAEWGDILADVHAQFSGTQDLVLELWLQINGSVGLTRMGKPPGVVSADCSDCGCTWCHDFDFTTGAHGWTSSSGFTGWGAQLVSGGWEQIPTGCDDATFAIQFPGVGVGKHLTQVIVYYDATFTGVNPTIDLQDHAGISNVESIAAAQMEYVFNTAFTQASDSAVVSLPDAGSGTSPNRCSPRKIVKVRVCGDSGSDPYAGL